MLVSAKNIMIRGGVCAASVLLTTTAMSGQTWARGLPPCELVSGSGTVTNPDPDDVLECSGTFNGQVIGTGGGVDVTINGNFGGNLALVTGAPSTVTVSNGALVFGQGNLGVAAAPFVVAPIEMHGELTIDGLVQASNSSRAVIAAGPAGSSLNVTITSSGAVVGEITSNPFSFFSPPPGFTPSALGVTVEGELRARASTLAAISGSDRVDASC